MPSLIAGRVDAVVAFWNAEGVALRRRGVKTREFRVDDYGAPRYPELVLADQGLDPARPRDDVELALATCATDTAWRCATARRRSRGSARRRAPTRRSCAPSSTRSRRRWCRPCASTASALAGWARFDARFGILERPPDMDEAFPPSP